VPAAFSSLGRALKPTAKASAAAVVSLRQICFFVVEIARCFLIILIMRMSGKLFKIVSFLQATAFGSLDP
jgi:hypothetical protein